MRSDFNSYQVPIFLISYNRLTHLRQLVVWLETAGYENIHIVDNASTYPPLLEYLQKSPHHVHRLNENHGHLVVWKCGKFDTTLNSQFYVVSDCDVLPVEECPFNAIEFFYETLLKYDTYTKVGFSLKIDDLPDTYLFKDKVVGWEKQFWQPEIATGLIQANIDTTFALYKPGISPSDERWWKAIRTGFPYTARHLPWYQDSKSLSEEEIHYQRTLKPMSAHWSVTDSLALKEQNITLQNEVHALKSELQQSERARQHLEKNYWRLHKNLRDFIRAAMRTCLRLWRSPNSKN